MLLNMIGSSSIIFQYSITLDFVDYITMIVHTMTTKIFLIDILNLSGVVWFFEDIVLTKSFEEIDRGVCSSLENLISVDMIIKSVL